MKIYLIDFENAKDISGIKDLSEEDLVVIFYSEKAASIPIGIHLEILESKAHVEYKCAKVGGPNALDFQLDSYLGYLIKKFGEQSPEIAIVAKDGGYKYVAAFWQQEKSLEIKLLNSLSGKESAESAKKEPKKKAQTNTKPKTSSAKKEPTNRTKLKMALKSAEIALNDEDAKRVIDITLKAQSAKEANGELNKLFRDSTRAGEVFQVVKPFINQ